jgi:hypothetical protein
MRDQPTAGARAVNATIQLRVRITTTTAGEQLTATQDEFLLGALK